MKYIAILTVLDERNGETVGTKRVQIEDGAITPDGIEDLEDFVGQSISEYQREVYGA